MAIVADWLTVFGGAESVIESFTRIFPDAPIFTTVFVPEKMGALGKHHDVRTSFLQKLPVFLKKRHPIFLSFLPRAIESLDLSGYDIVLSSSSFVGKGVLTNPEQLHICYCHSPARYFWGDWKTYLKDFPIPSFLKLFLPRFFTEYRQWDALAGSRPDIMIGNSDFIVDSIQKYYRRGAKMISPPVDTKRFEAGGEEHKEDYYLYFGRLVPQKKVDLLIETFLKTPERKLIIAGSGRDKKKLQKMAAGVRNIEFSGFIPCQYVPRLLGRARALFSPQLEDAGIASLEALAAGTPVIAYGKGGVLTSLDDEKVRVFFDEQTPESVLQGIEEFEKREKDFDRKYLQKHTKQFSREVFEKNIKTFVKKEWKKFLEVKS